MANLGLYTIRNINENCHYYSIRHLFRGKKMIKVRESSIRSAYFKFVEDNDRKAVNKRMDWSDNKAEYLLEGAKVTAVRIEHKDKLRVSPAIENFKRTKRN